MNSTRSSLLRRLVPLLMLVTAVAGVVSTPSVADAASCIVEQQQKWIEPAEFGFGEGQQGGGSPFDAQIVLGSKRQVRVSEDCGGGGGKGGGSPIAAPTATLIASPSSIVTGDSSQLSWSSTAATACAGDGFDTGGVPGGSTLVVPDETTTYSIDCTGPGGSATDAAAVTVISPPLPQCSDSLDNDTDTLFDLADPGCEGDPNGDNEAFVPPPPPPPPPPPLAQCADGIDNDGVNGTDYPDDPGCSSALDDNESTPPPSLTFSAPDRVRPQGSATIAWSATSVKAGSCSVTGNNTPSDQWTGESGSELSAPLTNETTFTLSCLDLADNATSTARVVKIAPSSAEE